MREYSKEYDDLILELYDKNDPLYNLQKTCEELAELSEVLLKKILKDKTPKKPTDQSIIDEIGDVQIRLDILKYVFGENAVNERIDYKTTKFKEYLQEQKYKGRI